MNNKDSLDKFVSAQQQDYETAFAEVKNGRKRSHWMWYIFPQVQGLGFSSTAQFYGIKDLAEATAYLAHPLLGPRLVNICKALLEQDKTNALEIFGSPDDLKLGSSMTLFAEVKGADPVFEQVIHTFYGGKKDGKTLAILQRQK
jgi:uncharacterized protein (DUF1810 family)